MRIRRSPLSAALALAGTLLAGCSAVDETDPGDEPPADAGARSCDVRALAAPDEGVLFGVNLDWGTETLSGHAEQMGLAPAVAVSFAGLPMSDQETEWLAGAVGQTRELGAALLLTLEPHEGLALDEESIAALGRRLRDANRAGVPVVVRFAHEMNGSWYAWGQQPTAYIEAFRRVADVVHATPASSMMWAPNYGGGYPFTGGAHEAAPGSASAAAADTDGDGILTAADDPYAPYWPGDEYVDWVGMTLYHWGSAYPWGENEEPEEGKFTAQLRGEYVGAAGDESVVPDFYGLYGEQRGKPVAIPETSALYAPENGGAPELDLKRLWWRQVLDEETLAALPLLKMVNWFAWHKEEAEVGGAVDWRVSADAEVRQAFLDDLPGNLVFASGSPLCGPG